jgi:hypothetical protein
VYQVPKKDPLLERVNADESVLHGEQSSHLLDRPDHRATVKATEHLADDITVFHGIHYVYYEIPLKGRSRVDGFCYPRRFASGFDATAKRVARMAGV